MAAGRSFRFWRYGYDFTMPIGTLVTASRDARCCIPKAWVRRRVQSDESRRDRSRGKTLTVDSHPTHGGALVSSGELVETGDAIGLDVLSRKVVPGAGWVAGLFIRPPCGTVESPNTHGPEGEPDEPAQ